jgi:excisionase family DNA binding protein
MPELLNVGEVAEILRVSRASVYAMAAARALPSLKVGALLRFDREDVQRWIESRKAVPTGGAR